MPIICRCQTTGRKQNLVNSPVPICIPKSLDWHHCLKHLFSTWNIPNSSKFKSSANVVNQHRLLQNLQIPCLWKIFHNEWLTKQTKKLLGHWVWNLEKKFEDDKGKVKKYFLYCSQNVKCMQVWYACQSKSWKGFQI